MDKISKPGMGPRPREVEIHQNNFDIRPFHSLLSWRSIFAGLSIALFVYLLLFTMGIGIGAISLVDGVEMRPESLGVVAGLTIVLMATLALFSGSYFSSRISRSSAHRVGMAQSLVISALFFGVLAFQLSTALGSAGRAIGSLVGASGVTMASIAQEASGSPIIQDIIDESVEGLNLNSTPEVVVRGVTARLIRGDTLGARNYLARQAGMSPEEAQGRIDRAQAQVQSALSQTAETAARTFSTAAWSLFLMMAIGALGSIAGGWLGSHRNISKPLDFDEIMNSYVGNSVAV